MPQMRMAILAMTISAIAAMPAHAEERAPAPETTIGATPPAGTGHQRCVDVVIGGERSFGCLNEKLKRTVDQVNPVLNLPPIDAKSQDLKVGVVNVPAVQQQYGQNFGRSAFPYRPPPPVFTSPVGRR